MSSSERFFDPVIDQHDTWLAVNPVQGCPKDCAYCYLKDQGQTLVRPQQVATPDETLALLLDSPYYHPAAVLALYTCTDALATPRNRAHLIALLDCLGASAARNPVCLITKCAVTADVLDCITRNQAAGLPIIVYLSYSGLGPDVEHGIDHEALRRNFPLLHDAGVPIIHYWRPALPQNSSPATITYVLDWVTRYARCSVAAGLKVKPHARDQMAPLWPKLRDPELNVEAAASIWPRSIWESLHTIPDRYGDYPIYHTNTCALSYVLGTADRANVLSSPTCQNINRCPAEQRDRCIAALPLRAVPTAADIAAHLVRLGYSDIPHTWDPATRTLTIHAAMQLRDRHNMAQVHGITVQASREPTDRYWSGNLAGGEPLILDADTL
ncbi:radical SAM family protein [Microtetraspora malaysiensis]|uniref:Radical SAM protein n=1 Tax=Microtetraspora malaysiensis TaxID=161358 RepID=A0ABW6T326_9ACTN